MEVAPGLAVASFESGFRPWLFGGRYFGLVLGELGWMCKGGRVAERIPFKSKMSGLHAFVGVRGSGRAGGREVRYEAATGSYGSEQRMYGLGSP